MVSKRIGPSVIGTPYIAGDHWARYTGVDRVGDGIGELPHHVEPGSTDPDLSSETVLPLGNRIDLYPLMEQRFQVSPPV